MDSVEESVVLLQELLGVALPKSYQEVIGSIDASAGPSPILCFPMSLQLASVWGATEFLRAARPDLTPQYIVLNFDRDHAVCLDLKNGDEIDAPVVDIDLERESSPERIYDTIGEYLEEIGKTLERAQRLEGELNIEGEGWFQHGLDCLEEHMNNISFKYDHKDGGQLPRAQVWRPYRFCVQDIILGITVVRHNRLYNCLEVDVFLTAEIPEYDPDSGCRALALIILADAYKSGGSMEIKFTRKVEGRRVPREICDLAAKLKVDLHHIDEGGITPKEAKRLFQALSGFDEKVIRKVSDLEEKGKLSAASLCYAMHHGAWTREELEIILFLSESPETVLTGSYPSELWHLHHYDLRIGRTALLGSYLDRQLRTKIHPLKDCRDETGGEMITELEDDERSLDIEFVPESGAKRYALGIGEEDPVPVPWIDHGIENFMLGRDKNLLVILSSRDAEELRNMFEEDLNRAIHLQQTHPEEQVCLMVTADFKRLDSKGVEFAAKAKAGNVGIIICPEYVNQMDHIVAERFESVKLMRS
jgi:hypothetical protein